MKLLSLFALAVALQAEDAPNQCLSGRGPLQIGQDYCTQILHGRAEYIGRYVPGDASFLRSTVFQNTYEIYDATTEPNRWISITDGHVTLSEGLNMEDALLLMNRVYKDQISRMRDEAAKQRKWVSQHLHDDTDGLNRIQGALKGQPVSPEPWHKRAKRRI